MTTTSRDNQVPDPGIQPWQEMGRTVVFEKHSRAVEKVHFRLPGGTERDFYIKAERPAAGVLALTPYGEVILVRQYRPGPRKILNELPGGFLDPGEAPLTTVQREFREETGYEGNFTFIGSWVDDAYSTMVRYGYIAQHCTQVAEPINDEREETQVVLAPLEEFREQLRAGLLTDVELGYLGLDHLGLL